MVAAARQFVRLPPQGIRDRPDTRFGFFRRIGQESELAAQQLGMVPYVLPAPKVGDEEPEGGERHEETGDQGAELVRSEEHTSELQSLMRISYAVFCLKQKK